MPAPRPVCDLEHAKAKAVKAEHKALGVVCFGYFRYRNARFGCAEVHQAIQALGRESMGTARTLAQQEGYSVVHALTDCVFLHKPGVTREQALATARRITLAVGVRLRLEGIYRWLVLLPSKTHSTTSLVGAPNRYYGKFADGTLKVRGIEVRRGSTAPFLHDVQQRMLAELAVADDAAGFMARVPHALRVAKAAARDLIARRVPAAELAVSAQATRTVEEYVADTGARTALRQLRQAGDERRPGQHVQYVITRRDGPHAGRARAAALLDAEAPWFGQAPVPYHVDAYLRLLAREVETLFAPFGYTEDAVHAWLAGTARSPVPRTPAATLTRPRVRGVRGPTG